MSRLRVSVLISGRGSNLQALMDAAAKPRFPAEIALVVSNEPDAQGLARARRAGIPTCVVDHRAFADRAGFEAEVDAALRAAATELVCLAGFMRLLTGDFVDRWRDRLVNIHPSLLPAFRGLDTHARAIAAGVRVAGCTVHFVRPAMDEGPIIAQAAVPVLAGDDAAALARRVLAEEHRIYPLAVRLIAEGRVRVEGERVTIDGMASPRGALVNPAPPAAKGRSRRRVRAARRRLSRPARSR
jgi:phosphoribosylglycinamide formyltransferase-1